MGDNLILDMSDMKISLHGQELKAVKEITIPPDVELSGDLSSGQINAFPDEVHGNITLKPKCRPRRRQIERAYKIMGTTIMRELCRATMKKWLLNGGRAIMKSRANTGKSAALSGILDYAENIEGGKDDETLLHFASLHGERGKEQG